MSLASPGSASDAAARTRLVRASLAASLLSVAWAGASGSLAIAVGVRDGSGVLVALGAIVFLDAAASAILVEHFLHTLRHEQVSTRRERAAHRSVTVGLLCVGLGTAIVSIVRLIGGHGGAASVASIVLAVASGAVLVGLARWKRSLALRLRSSALLGDSHLSAIGATQAAVAVVGTALIRALGWTWVDAAAALGVGLIALALGVSIASHEFDPD